MITQHKIDRQGSHRTGKSREKSENEGLDFHFKKITNTFTEIYLASTGALYILTYFFVSISVFLQSIIQDLYIINPKYFWK